MEALRPSMGLYASFSGISHTSLPLRFRRFTVASSSISATMISPLWASRCWWTTTRSPGRIPAFSMDSPRTRRAKYSPSRPPVSKVR